MSGFPAEPQPTESVQREGLLDHLVVHTQAGGFCPFHTGIFNHLVNHHCSSVIL